MGIAIILCGIAVTLGAPGLTYVGWGICLVGLVVSAAGYFSNSD